MAKIGLSKPYFAKYGMSGSSVVYSDGALLGKAITWDLSLDSASDNVLYADNAPAETENTFAGGSLTVGTDELMPDVAAAIFGVVAQTLTISGMATTGASYVVYDDDQSTPDLGIGAIAKIQKNGAIKYQAIMLCKVKFNNANDSLETQGETITWQTPELEGKVMRDDSAKHAWKKMSSFLDSEADAELVLQEWLNID